MWWLRATVVGGVLQLDRLTTFYHADDLPRCQILQLLDENINALRATAQQKLEAMTPVPSPTARRPMHASRHIVDQRRIDEQAGQSRATPVIFVKDGPDDFDGDQDLEHRNSSKARRFRPDSQVVVDVESSHQNFKREAFDDELDAKPNLEAATDDDSESFAEHFGEAAHLSSPQHFHPDLPDSAFGSDIINAAIDDGDGDDDGDQNQGVDEVGSPHHQHQAATPKQHVFQQSAAVSSTDLPDDVRTEVKAARQPLPPPQVCSFVRRCCTVAASSSAWHPCTHTTNRLFDMQAQPDTPHSLKHHHHHHHDHPSLPSPIQTSSYGCFFSASFSFLFPPTSVRHAHHAIASLFVCLFVLSLLSLDYDQLRQEKMNEARALLEEAPSTRRRRGQSVCVCLFLIAD